MKYNCFNNQTRKAVLGLAALISSAAIAQTSFDPAGYTRLSVGLHGSQYYDILNNSFGNPTLGFPFYDVKGLNGDNTKFDLGGGLDVAYFASPTVSFDLSWDGGKMTGANDLEFYNSKVSFLALGGNFAVKRAYRNSDYSLVPYLRTSMNRATYAADRMLISDGVAYNSISGNAFQFGLGAGLRYHYNDRFHGYFQTEYLSTYTDGFDGFDYGTGRDYMLKTTLGVRYSFGDMKHIDRERAYLAINDMLKEDMMRSLNYWKQNFQDTIDMLRKELHLAIKAAQYSRPSIIDVAFIARKSDDQSDSVRIVFSDMTSETRAISLGGAAITIPTAGTTGSGVLANMPVERIKELVKLESNVIGFATGQTSLSVEGRAIAAVILDEMKADMSLIVTVVGHTDDVADDALNMRISVRRAQNVADYLIENGIAADRITVIGKGETEPLLNQQTETARRINRRVEFKFIPDQQ